MRTKKLNAEQCEYFSKAFPVMSNTEVALLLNVSVTTVKNYADIMELKKDPAYLSSVPFLVVKIESTTGAPDGDAATDKVTVTFSAPKALVPCVV